MQLEIAKPSDKKIWDALVAHPLQTWEWAASKEANGTPVDRIFILEKGIPVAAYLITYHPLFSNKLLAYCGRSPWPKKEHLLLLAQHCKDKQCACIKFEPTVLIEAAGKEKLPLLHHSWEQEGLLFVQSKSTVMAQHTFMIDTLLPEETLLSIMKSKTRYNIRLATKKGVIVRDTTDEKEGFDDFYSLYSETCSRQHYYGRNRAYLESVWQTHKNSIARIYTAFFEGKPLSSYMIFYWDKQAYYVYGGSSEKNKEVMASNLLMWEVIRDVKKRGCEWFDMWGALPQKHDANDPWVGFHKFKEGYCPIHRTFIPPIDVVLDTKTYGIFDTLWPMRNLILKILPHKIQ